MRGLFYVRAVEAADGTWRCRVGLTEIDEHDKLLDALLHLRSVGQAQSAGVPFEIVAHPLGGPPQFFRGAEIANLGTA